MYDEIVAYAGVLIREIFSRRYWLFGGFALVSFVILAVGMRWEKEFDTAITIYADNQNVIKPLLEGGAPVTMPRSERIRVVREVMFSPRLLRKVVTAIADDPSALNEGGVEEQMVELRQNVDISAPADDYIKIEYSHVSPEVSYQVVNKIVNLFIEESAATKRAESKSAYTFIDEQVKSYKGQLVEAENKLKAFEAANVDGVDADVTTSIARMRQNIDEISIEIEAQEIRVQAQEAQLAQENRFAARDYRATVFRERLAQLESAMDTMRLSLRDEHPDLVDLRMRITELKTTIIEVESQNNANTEVDESNLNPFYEQLNTALGNGRVDLQAARHRHEAYKSRLEEQYKRRVRVASNQAELSELTRDYSVTKQIYEDLLERKERARISMTLDLAGQGVSYKVLEPAVFPVTPVGLRLIHFAVAGPVVGSLAPLGILVILVFLSPGIKVPQQLEKAYPGIVLAVVPRRPKKVRILHVFMLFSAWFAGYCALGLVFRFVL